MEDVCNALDQTVIDIFQALEDLHNSKEKLEEVMKEGFFQISRSRYSLGVKRVNADQILDAELSCTRSVSLQKSKEEILDLCAKDFNPDSDSDLKVFELNCKKIATGGKKKDSEDVKGEIDVNTELRKRGKKSAKEKELEDECLRTIKDLSLDEENTGNKFVLTNPINLFGVLVPQSLRASQQCFESAVSLSVDIANIQAKLSSLQKKYLHFNEKKKSMSNSNTKENDE